MVSEPIRRPPPMCPSMGLLLVPIALACLGADDPPAAPGQARSMPMASGVEAQPLLAQLRRVRDAMTSIGNPLPVDVAERLDAIGRMTDAEAVCAEVQKALDGLCLVAIEVDRDGKLAVFRGGADPELVEQGWRSFLIKVVNRAGATGRLRVRSPNAGPVPNAPRDEVATRWLGLDLYDGQPIRADLGGLELEYRILQVFGRDPGEKAALLEFNAAPRPAGRPPRSANGDSTAARTAGSPRTRSGCRPGRGPCTSKAPGSTRSSPRRSRPARARWCCDSGRSRTGPPPGSCSGGRRSGPGPTPATWPTSTSRPIANGSTRSPSRPTASSPGSASTPASQPGHMRIDWMELAYADRPARRGRACRWSSAPRPPRRSSSASGTARCPRPGGVRGPRRPGPRVPRAIEAPRPGFLLPAAGVSGDRRIGARAAGPLHHPVPPRAGVDPGDADGGRRHRAGDPGLPRPPLDRHRGLGWWSGTTTSTRRLSAL
jgi:hypothetical protein